MGCLKTIKVDRSNLSSTKWQNGLMFIWESHHSGGCWSAVGRVPGFVDPEYTAFQSILETGAPSGWQVIGFGTECGGDTGKVHHLEQCPLYESKSLMDTVLFRRYNSSRSFARFGSWT